MLSERLSYAFSDPFAIEFLTGLSEIVEEHGISIVLMPLSRRRAGSSPAEADESDVTAVRHANIDALTILSLPADHPAAMLARARGIRLVTTSASNDPESSWVAIDDFGAGVMVGEHLAGLGHRDIAVLVETNQPAGSPGRRLDAAELIFLDYAARVAGLRKAMPGQVMIVSGGHNSIESGATATTWLLDHDQLPTAVVGLSDVLALGALQALREPRAEHADRRVGVWLRRHPRRQSRRSHHGSSTDPGQGATRGSVADRPGIQSAPGAAADQLGSACHHRARASVARSRNISSFLRSPAGAYRCSQRVLLRLVVRPGSVKGERSLMSQLRDPGQQLRERRRSQQC